ncbi:MAG: polysaccharide biosynthesis/export family protein [Pseudomonadota bacterium]
MTFVRFLSCAVMICAAFLSGCSSGVVDAPTALREGQVAQSTDLKTSYMLGSGDQVRLIVYEEPELSGSFSVDDAGQLSLPLIGAVGARGLTVTQLKESIVARFKDGYLRDPKVGLEILRYRPFYISGEVSTGGEYPYVVGLTVPQAIATAGGYSRRANKQKVTIIRASDGTRFSYPANQATRVFPGDVIEVPERFF